MDPEEPRKPETGAQNRSWVPYNHSQGLQRDLRGVQNELRDPPEDLPEHPKAPSAARGSPHPPKTSIFRLVFLWFSIRPSGHRGHLVFPTPSPPMSFYSSPNNSFPTTASLASPRAGPGGPRTRRGLRPHAPTPGVKLGHSYFEALDSLSSFLGLTCLHILAVATFARWLSLRFECF